MDNFDTLDNGGTNAVTGARFLQAAAREVRQLRFDPNHAALAETPDMMITVLPRRDTDDAQNFRALVSMHVYGHRRVDWPRLQLRLLPAGSGSVASLGAARYVALNAGGHAVFENLPLAAYRVAAKLELPNVISLETDVRRAVGYADARVGGARVDSAGLVAIVCGDAGDVVRLWDVTGEACLGEITTFGVPLLRVSCIAGAPRLLVHGADGSVWLTDLDGVPRLHFLPAELGRGGLVAASHDGSKLLLCDNEGSTSVRDGDGEILAQWSVPGTAHALAIASQGEFAAVGCADGTVQLQHLASGKQHQLSGHMAAISTLVFTDYDRRLVSSALDGTVRIWDTDSGHCLQVIDAEDDEPLRVTVSPDGTRIAIATEDGVVRLSLAQRDGARAVTTSTEDTCLAVTPDGTLALTAAEDGSLRLHAPHGHRGQDLHGHTQRVRYIAMARDGACAVSASEDHTLRIWSLPGGECRGVLRGHVAPVVHVTLTPDSRRAVSASRDNTLRVWALSDGRCERVLAGHQAPVNDAVITPDGRRAISASRDATLRIWDLASGQCEHVLEGHLGSVEAVAVSLDGAHAISSGADQTVRFWSLQSGECIRTLVASNDDSADEALTADVARIISASTNGTIGKWPNSTGSGLPRYRDAGSSFTPSATATASPTSSEDPWLWRRTIDIERIESLQFIDNQLLAIITESGTVFVLNADDGTLRATFMTVATDVPGVEVLASTLGATVRFQAVSHEEDLAGLQIQVTLSAAQGGRLRDERSLQLGRDGDGFACRSRPWSVNFSPGERLRIGATVVPPDSTKPSP